MIIWLVERPDKAAHQECLQWLSRRLAEKTQGRAAITWRILPAARLWAECVELLKNKNYPSSQYPALIEYPAAWQGSLEFLGLLSKSSEAQPDPSRWQALKEDVGRLSLSSEMSRQYLTSGADGNAGTPSSFVSREMPANGFKEILSFPWFVGFTMLFYRKDLLRAMGKTPEDLAQYAGWFSMVRYIQALGRYRALDMPVSFTTALWWILNAGGAFLDPLNLMPAFHQAEALKALEAMLSALVSGPAKNTAHSAQRSFTLGMGPGYPGHSLENCFSLLSSHFPRSLKQGDLRIGCTLPPRLSSFTVVAEEYVLGVTRRGLEREGVEVLEFLENLFRDDAAWLEMANRLGILPANCALWEPFFEGFPDPMLKEVYSAAAPHLKWIPSSPFLAPTIQIFESSMVRLYLGALRDGTVDVVRIASVLNKAAAEYRLMVALYGHEEKISKFFELERNSRVPDYA